MRKMVLSATTALLCVLGLCLLSSPCYPQREAASLPRLRQLQEGVGRESLPPLLQCAHTVLTSHGESIFQVDTDHSVIITGFRFISPPELQRIANTTLGGQHIRWTRGMYQLTLTLPPDAGDTPHIQVSARILGAGHTSLPLLRPSHWWPLPSNGTLEGDLLAALTACQG